jgi:hypothetical protein
MRRSQGLVRLMERLGTWLARKRGKAAAEKTSAKAAESQQASEPTGTFIRKLDAAGLRQKLAEMHIPVEIRVWRSVSVRWLRALIHGAALGRFWLRLLYRLEERFPHYFGEQGQYPMVIFSRPEK